MTSIFDQFRSGRYVGFEPLFTQLDEFMKTASRITWPPYNVTKLTEQAFLLQFAVAGFSKDEVSVQLNGNHLHIQGKLKCQAHSSMIYQGISARDFSVIFLLADGVEINDVVLYNGLLSIHVQKPEMELPFKRFDIRVPDMDEQPAKSMEYQTSDLMDELRDHQEAELELDTPNRKVWHIDTDSLQSNTETVKAVEPGWVTAQRHAIRAIEHVAGIHRKNG